MWNSIRRGTEGRGMRFKPSSVHEEGSPVSPLCHQMDSLSSLSFDTNVIRRTRMERGARSERDREETTYTWSSLANPGSRKERSLQIHEENPVSPRCQAGRPIIRSSALPSRNLCVLSHVGGPQMRHREDLPVCACRQSRLFHEEEASA